jgi:Fe-S cluster biogenesis protein NfuA
VRPEDGLPPEVLGALERLDQLVQEFEQHPAPAVQERVFELLQCVDAVHRAGLRRLGALLEETGLRQRALADPEARLLFDLYDLGEGGERQRAEAVLATVRPYVESHGGSLEVLEAEAGVVKVRLWDGCTSGQGSAATLREAVEHALCDGLPDFVRMEVLEAPPPPRPEPGFVPLSSLTRPKADA